MKEQSSSRASEKPEWLTHIEAVLEMLNEGIVITNEDQRILFVNSRFVEMTGIPQQEMLGADASEFYSEQEWAFLAQQIAVVRHQGRHRYEFLLPQEDGGRLPVIISSRILQNSEAEFRIITVSDISEQVRIAKELRSANAKLQERQLEIEEDLRLAAQVQTSLAPKSTVRGNLTVDSFYHPVHSIGGDFAVVNWHDQDQVSLLMCDVSGHGIGSALVANRIYSETSVHLRAGISFTDMFGKLNRFLMEDIAGSGMFVTVAAARIDARQRRMHFAGAGHPPAMIARGSLSPVLLQSGSMVLGALPDAEATSDSLEVELEPDDRVVLYTDGITDVFNSSGEMLGIEGVREIVREAASLPAEEMKQGILDGVVAWRNGPPTDDASLVLVHVR
jgi:PAS domain S-box-containing protein